MATTNINPGTSSQCKVCQQPASKHCSRCAEGLDIDGVAAPTLYCSVACQTADFPTHKKVCRNANARKQLYRGGELLQKVFYAFREVAFTYDICEVRKQGDQIHFWDLTTVATSGQLFPFPKIESLTADEKKALLTSFSCGNVLAYMHKLIRNILQGIADTTRPVKEAAGFFNDVACAMWLHGPNGLKMSNALMPHVFVAATLTDGEAYAIDMSGAQFGQYRAVTPFRQYAFSHFSQHHFRFYDFGHETKRVRNMQAGTELPPIAGSDASDFIVHTKVATAMYAGLKQWESAGNTVVGLLKDTQVKFEARTAALVECLVKAMDDRINALQARPGLPRELSLKRVPGQSSPANDGKDKQSADRRGNEAAGSEAAGSEAAGSGAAGSGVAGSWAAGSGAAGTEAAGTEAAGTEAAGIAPSPSNPVEATTSDQERVSEEDLRLLQRFASMGGICSMANDEFRVLDIKSIEGDKIIWAEKQE